MRGTAAAPGIAVGPARVLEDLSAPVEERDIGPAGAAAEAERFQAALSRTREELIELQEATRRDLGEHEADIFSVQLMVLEDPLVVDRTVEAISTEHKNAEFLFCRHVKEVSDRLEGLADAFFADRAVDLLDVKRRVLRHLTGDRETALPGRPGILIGRELTPSEAVNLDPEVVLGIATELGGVTSHATIMARARGIPAVVGIRDLEKLAFSGDTVAVDGISGRVTVNPTRPMLEKLRHRRRAYARLQRQRARLAGQEACTRDGHRVVLAANMELPDELEFIRSRGAEGVGLFRTEFFFMRHQRMPTEDEQYEVYRGIVEGLPGFDTVIRVMDVGGDKFASYLGLPRERNPYLGMRGIRYLLAHPDTFRTQLRALLRAAVHGPVKILFPMLSSVDEFMAARAHVKAAAAALRRRGEKFDPRPSLGVMIEVPSAVLLAEEFARRADFLSIGSNDLIQYLLAIDRDHDTLGHLFQPLHPAVLRAIAKVVEAGHAHERWVAICGEMAGDPRALPLLLGFGIDRFSVSPSMVPEIKQAVRSVSFEDCRRLAADALECHSPHEVRSLVEERLGSEYSSLLKLAENGANGNGAG